MKVDFNRFKKIVTILALTFLVIHISLGLFLTFSKGRALPGGRVLGMYQSVLHTGPFFSEGAIKWTTRVRASYLEQDEWKDITVVEDRLRNYQNGPWRMHELLRRDYVRHHCNVLYGVSDKMKSPRLKKLNDYLVETYSLQNADSIRIHYTLEEYRREEDSTHVYTYFYIQYHPSDVR